MIALPQIWSNPTTTLEFVRAAGKNILNIIPPWTLEDPVFSTKTGGRNIHYICDPELIQLILRDRANDFPKGDALNMLIQPVSRKSLLITEGEEWRNQHKKMIKVFSWRNVQNFQPMIERITDRYLDQHLDQILYARDVLKPMQHLTFQLIGELITGAHPSQHMHEFAPLFERYMKNGSQFRLTDFITITYGLLPNTRYVSEWRTLRAFDRVTKAIINERLDVNITGEPDFLEHLIEAYDYRRNPTREGYQNIRDNLITFFIAGHETTATTLAWALYVAGFFPESQAAMAAEAKRPANDKPITHAFIDETLRIYPPAPVLTRITPRAQTLGDVEMKAGDSVLIPLVTLHRHRNHWDDPDMFDPSRFQNDRKPSAFTYMPFGAGPRVCIGKSLAQLEAGIMLSKLLERMELMEPTHRPLAHQYLTLRSANGIKINAIKR